MLRAFKRAQAGVSLPVLEAALSSADQGRLSQLGDVSAALLEMGLSGPAPALNVARRKLWANSRLRLLIYASPSLAVSLGATQAAAGAGAAAALCKTGVGVAQPIPKGAKGVIIEEVIALRQQGLTYAQIRDKLGWASTFKPHAIIKKYAPQLAGKSKTLIPSVPGTLPKPAPQTVPKPAGRSIRVPTEHAGDFTDLAKNEFDRLSKPAWEAVESYKASGYTSINDILRDQAKVLKRWLGPKEQWERYAAGLKKTIAQLDKVFLRLENELTVYRGGWGSRVKVGDVFADKAFVSTSISADVAEDFIAATHTVWKIKVPRGARITLPCCGNMDELEILLPRGSKFRVTAITDTEKAERLVEAVLVI